MVEAASYGMAGREEEGKSCVLGSVGSCAACKARPTWSVCMCVSKS